MNRIIQREAPQRPMPRPPPPRQRPPTPTRLAAHTLLTAGAAVHTVHTGGAGVVGEGAAAAGRGDELQAVEDGSLHLGLHPLRPVDHHHHRLQREGGGRLPRIEADVEQRLAAICRAWSKDSCLSVCLDKWSASVNLGMLA